MPKITDMNYNCLPPLPRDASVTMAYVPFQTNADMYDEEYALMRGTLFTSLDKPLLRGCERCE